MSPHQHPKCQVSFEKQIVAPFSYHKVISLDIFCFLVWFTIGFSDISLNQIVQDKICLNNLRLPIDVCRNIQDHQDYLFQAIDIYGQVSLWKSYSTLISCFPGILITLFLGKWLDQNPKMMKYVLAGGPFGSFLGSLIVLHQLYHFEIDYMVLLISNVPKFLNGATFFTCVFSLVATTSPLSHRMIRFGMIEFCIQGGALAGTLFGGSVLALEPRIGLGLQNYTTIFVVASLINLIATIWALTMINTREPHTLINQTDKKRFKKYSFRKSDHGLGQMIMKLFDISNVLYMVKTCTKRRSNKKHLHLWLSFLSIVIFIFCFFGAWTIEYQFSQLVYHWSSVYYSTARAAASMIPTIMGPFWPHILQKWFHLEDTACGLIGILSAMLSFLVRGSIRNSFAFYFSSIIGALTSTFIPSIRSIISKSIDSNETSQVFTILQCLETFAAMVNGFLYSLIFTYTADSNPGFVYQVMACIFMIPLLAILWIDIDVRHAKNLKPKKPEKKD